MKDKAFSIFLIFISFFMLATVASSVQITKIGTGHYPAIYGNMVTWSDDTGSIHVYDLDTQKDTTINSSSSSHPAIYGNKIVWHDDSNGATRLTVYNIPSGTKSYITQNVDSTSTPKIYGNRIVWGSNGTVYLFDISTSAQTQIAVGINPDIYDTKIVYSADGREIRDIFMYDILTQKTELVSPESSDIDWPHIYGNNVIWTNSRTRMGFIQMYDLVTKKAIDVTSDNTGNTIIPEGFSYADAGDDTGTHTDIYGDKIVYAKVGNDQFGNIGVYAYNISTGQSSPVINYPVELYTTPEIYDNTVVWGFESSGWIDNAGDEIYVCNLATIAVTQQSVANFTSNVTSGNMPLSVAFTDTSIGTPTSWSWDFGDGTNSTEKNPMHIYSAVGNYIVNLTVSENNSIYSKSATITVLKLNLLSANFSTSVSKGYIPLDVQFTDLSENAKFWYWDFGDGTFDSAHSTQQNPIHTYLKAGNYTVTLAASDYNSTDYKSATITVLEKPELSLPVADFSSNLVSGFAPLDVQFTDASQNATGWNWDFGDGATSTEKNPTHTYFSAGSYFVNLTVNNSNKTSSKYATITVLEDASTSGGSSHSSSGGSGGGGAGSSPESQSNVAAKELSQAFIFSGNRVNFDFPQKATPVVNVSFDSKKTVGKTITIVETLKGKSTLVSGLPSDEIYKFVNIWVGNGGFATPKNIENEVLCFKVEKSWVQNEKIDKSTITLNWYSDSTWKQLPTSLSDEDDTYLYFIAQTTGFSHFAITGKNTATGTIKPSEGKTQPTVNAARNNTNDGIRATSTDQTPERKESPGTSGKMSTKTPGFEAVGGIVSLLTVFLYKRNRRGKL